MRPSTNSPPELPLPSEPQISNTTSPLRVVTLVLGLLVVMVLGGRLVAEHYVPTLFNKPVVANEYEEAIERYFNEGCDSEVLEFAKTQLTKVPGFSEAMRAHESVLTREV